MELLKKIRITHKTFWNRETTKLALVGGAFLLFALFFQYFANNYANYAETTPVGDLLLDNLPAINLDIFIVQGVLLLTVFIVVLFVIYPKYIPFSLKTISLFIIIRSYFFCLTHLGGSLHQVTLNINQIGFDIYDFLYNSKNDFFFSGHTGIPILFGLIFYEHKFLRHFFFAVSVIFGASMILAHMHYSIDVFAAPFITYGIFKISEKLFKNEIDLIA